MAESNPYEPPQSLAPPAGISKSQKKLLLVLVVQLCLPGAAELLHQAVPAAPWLVPIAAINAVCFSCACYLLWPRWHWMLGAALVAIACCITWVEVYLYSNGNFADLSNDSVADLLLPKLNFRASFYVTLVRSAGLACVATVILFYHYTLIWNPPRSAAPARVRRISWSSLLYYAVCAALIIGGAVKLYNPETADILGYAINDLCLLTLALIVFFQLLQPAINWWSFGLTSLGVGLIWLLIDPTIGTYWPWQEACIYMSVAVSFATLSVLLYRWAGFRIVPRRDLAMNTQTSNT